MKEQPRTQVRHFQNSNFKHKMIRQNFVYEKFYLCEKVLRTGNCRRTS